MKTPAALTDTNPVVDPAERIAELEDELKQVRAKLREVTNERDEANALVSRLREHVEDVMQTREQWIDVFDMQQEDGKWVFDPEPSELWAKYDALLDENLRLIQEWNKFVGKYNAKVFPRDRGRPLAASEVQQKDVLKRHKGKASLREIAAATALSLQTVRTIIDNTENKGCTGKRTKELRRKEFNRLRAASYRARKRAHDTLPAQITEQQKTGEALLKAAKGLGR